MSLQSDRLTQFADRRPPIVRGKAKERWMELCAQAAKEQNTDRLIEMVQEINRILEEKGQRLERDVVGRGL